LWRRTGWMTPTTRPTRPGAPPRRSGCSRPSCAPLDAAGAVTPERSAGGHRRYTRRQLAFAGRVRELFDQGHNLGSALRIRGLQDDIAALQDDIVGLQGDLATERARAARLQRRLGHGRAHSPAPSGGQDEEGHPGAGGHEG
jgi:hypothetical protein